MLERRPVGKTFHFDGHLSPCAGRETNGKEGTVHSLLPAVQRDAEALVLSVGAPLDDDGPSVHLVKIDQRQTGLIGSELVHKRRHVLRYPGPPSLGIEVA